MKILDKYIARQINTFILIVALAFWGFDIFFNLVHELQVVGKGQYTLGVALQYLSLITPSRLYTLFPWAALIGTLISLGALANHSELVVMRTSSVSVARITWSVLKAALILLIVVVFLGEGVAPLTERVAQHIRTLALSDGQSIQTAYGIWVRQGQEFIHVQSTRSDGELLGVTRYQFDDKRKLKEVMFAKRADPVKEGWQLYDVQGTIFLDKKTWVFKEAVKRVHQLVEPQILETAMVKHPERLSLLALWGGIQYRVKNGLSSQQYELALYTKLFQPLVILMMVFLAVPFVFGPLRSVSMGFRIVVGIFVAFLFNTLNSLFAPLAIVYQFPPLLAVLLPIIVFTGVGIFILRRAK